MVNNCANPQCNKPLHYLRDGRIFVFEVQGDKIGTDGKRLRHVEHYWLCGDCSPNLQLERHLTEGVKLLPRAGARSHREPAAPAEQALAS